MNRTDDTNESNEAGQARKTHSATDRGGEPSKRPRSSLTVLLPVLAILLVVLGFEYKARIQAQRVYRHLDTILETTEDATPTLDEVHAKIGRAPDGAAQRMGTVSREQYTWKGVIRSYTVFVDYQVGNVPLLYRVGFNQPPESSAPAVSSPIVGEDDGPAPAAMGGGALDPALAAVEANPGAEKDAGKKSGKKSGKKRAKRPQNEDPASEPAKEATDAAGKDAGSGETPAAATSEAAKDDAKTPRETKPADDSPKDAAKDGSAAESKPEP